MHSENFQINVMQSNCWLSVGHLATLHQIRPRGVATPLRHAGDFINIDVVVVVALIL